MRLQTQLILLCAGVALCGVDASGQQQTQPPTSRWITDPATLLKHLKQRDAEFDNRSLEIEQRWTEKVSPRSQVAARNRAARRFGQPVVVPKEPILEDFDQPHRVHYQLTVRGSEVTLERKGELETMNHPEYVALPNKGHRWSTVGGVERSYSPETKTLHLMGRPKPGTVLASNRWMFEWCCGYGFARQMESIESVRVQGERMFVKGKTRLMNYDDSRVELELDRDYIVRCASVFVPVQRGSGGNRFVVETTGTERPKDGPPVAKTGHYERILQPGNKPERLYQEYDIAFIGVSAKLTDQQYSTRTAINPPDDATTVDFRPRTQK